MNDFKLIAIRPLRGCHPKFFKVLKPNKIYQFYNDYTFTKGRGIKVKNVVLNTTVPNDLYQLKGKNRHLNINVSAVVGKNGAGKSSLFDLLFALCFSISAKYDIIPNFDLIIKSLEDSDSASNKIILKDLELVSKKLKAEVYYSIDKSIYLVQYSHGKITCEMLDGIKWKKATLRFRDFFYSIVINYSLYGLNSYNYVWLNSLFHKNDGYQTPIVINPFRDNGNIDVNSEYHLAQTRLLSNLSDLSSGESAVVNGKTISEIEFVINPDEIDSFQHHAIKNIFQVFESENKLDIFQFYNKLSTKLVRYSLPKSKLKNLSKLLKQDLNADASKKFLFKNAPRKITEIDVEYLLIKYAVRKVLKICFTYREYNRFSTWTQFKVGKIPTVVGVEKLIDDLSKDHSHITMKLRQVLFSVKESYFKKKPWRISVSGSKNYNYCLTTSITLHELKTLTQQSLKTNARLVREKTELIPGGLIKPKLKIKLPNGPSTEFYYLSSGEQQFVHVLHTLFYHLQFINSVHKSSSTTKIKYKYVNLMLDEIELYFHPEFQKGFLKELLLGIERLNLGYIKGINILFSTHSPFILSDIPGNNTLRLRNGVPDNKTENVFGANIHELLANEFFLGGSFSGDYAIDYISDLINEIKSKENNSLTRQQTEVLYKKINILGEPFIKTKLTEILQTKARKTDKIRIEISEKVKSLASYWIN